MAFDIAVIGMDCRFPMANDPWELWKVLNANNTAIQDLSIFNQVKDLGKNYLPYKGLIQAPFNFDAEFFGFSSGEAKLLDPQHRLFFQTAFRTIESAGYNPFKIKSKLGIFTSCGFPGYLYKHLLPNQNVTENYDTLSLQLLNDKDFLATRLSYLLNCRGPSLTVQSGCSSSLLAIHLACQSLLFHESDMALAGGVALSFPIYEGYVYQKDSIGSKDGKIYSFDHRASGTVRGDGVGAVLLKRLDDAIADCDPIIALIKGSAVNNDGKSKVAFTAPGLPQQIELIKESMAISDLDFDDIDFIEAHGTGTMLGDPIEVRAIVEAFKKRTRPLILSSIKPHIGHLDIASGIASFIKTCLAISHRVLPHTLNFEKLNPLILPYQKLITVLSHPIDWISDNKYTAGVTSLGMGGTNVHMILQAYQGNLLEPQKTFESGSITLSAKNQISLNLEKQRLVKFFKENTEINLAGCVATINQRDRGYFFRENYNFSSCEELIQKLEFGACSENVQHDKYFGRREIVPGYVFVGDEFVVLPQTNEKIISKKTTLSLEDSIKNEWGKLLGKTTLQLTDNFFDLGGNSFMAIQCISKLPSEFEGKIGVLDFFKFPTLGEFIKHAKCKIRGKNNAT
ncbi:MAG: beta-ketoacyl synthase N-terminal-like domain-containing protein [Candidatus Babeliales bacterium]